LNSFYSQNENQSTKLSKTAVINSYYKIGSEFLATENFNKALKNISLGLEASKKIENKSLIGHGYSALGNYYYKKKEYQTAIDNFQKSLPLFIDLKNSKEIYNCYFKLGRSFYKISEFDASLENYFTSLEIAERNKNEAQIAINLVKIGEVYLLTPNLEKARTNFKKSLEINKRLKDDYEIVGSFINIGVTYQKQGDNESKKDYIVKAIEYYKEGLVRAKKANYKRDVSILLGNIGSSYRSLGKYNESLKYLFEALELQIELKDDAVISHTCCDISETYLTLNNFSKAKEYGLKALSYSRGVHIYKEIFATRLLSEIEYETGNYKKSHYYLKKNYQIRDSLFSIEKITKINDLQIKYETEKKNLKIQTQESNIALLDSENKLKNQWLFFGGLGLLSIFMFIILFKSKNTAKKEKEQQEEFSQNLLQSQEEERTRIARELHDSVGQQLTLIKRKSQNLQQTEITLLTNNALDEVRSISRGLYPALLKELGLTESIEQLINEYDEQTDLFFSMDIDTINHHFTESKSLNFYRLIQECLTNIVKHAKAKSVTVSIKKEGSSIITLIYDNGQGFDVLDSKKKNSLGLKTIFERIKIMKGKLSIDSKINNGTSFLFSIPVKNE
jgi:signal transduction histidine kinase/Tfp pilus assembly protein PilF